jgi:chromosome segregation ATPase
VCAACSDHFVTLAGFSDSSSSPKSAVRICDKCELHLSTGTGEELAVSEQISESLKLALREKAAEIEKFNSFLYHVLEDGEAGREKMDELRSEIESLCCELKTESEQYSRVKMDSADLEKDIRTVAQRCLKAEQQAREALPLAREIEEYSRHIGLQAKLADQFTERISRLHSQRLVSTTRRINSASPHAEIMSPRYQITQVGGGESLWQVLKWLLYFP